MSSDSSKSSTSDKSSNDQNFNIIQTDQTHVTFDDDSKSIENTTTTEASVSIDTDSLSLNNAIPPQISALMLSEDSKSNGKDSK